ncbi:adenylate/guanylate cyclase domain-containing protein [Prochlorothrix hollandica]|uniref:adenylate/guanylate cyclase domain-containing protein n=1 Tax=Prochlorothrix hollandica TaxID=1223 RepID=UPI003341EE1C
MSDGQLAQGNFELSIVSDILIVDDTADNIRLLSSMLLEQGYKVRKAINGTMALTAIRTLPPDLLLLDVNMPQMDGYEVCRQLKQDPQLRDIPVIFLSALDSTVDKVKAFAVGGIDYLTKPFHIEELVARIESQLTIARQRQLLQQQKQQLELEIQERRKVEAELKWQRERSETLILNIFPQKIAERLKSGHQTIASYFDEVTVLFADLVGFTTLAVQIPPTDLVQFLNQIFSRFDALVEQYQLEKIKTIGDAYMVVGGLPQHRDDHAQAIAQMALAMQTTIQELKTPLGQPLSLRIGINSGPVVAGVIGTKKFSYDLWGDTVNVASRLESQGEPGRIQISEQTHGLLHHQFHCEERGVICLKGRGELKTYWLLG